MSSLADRLDMTHVDWAIKPQTNSPGVLLIKAVADPPKQLIFMDSGKMKYAEIFTCMENQECMFFCQLGKGVNNGFHVIFRSKN